MNQETIRYASAFKLRLHLACITTCKHLLPHLQERTCTCTCSRIARSGPLLIEYLPGSLHVKEPVHAPSATSTCARASSLGLGGLGLGWEVQAALLAGSGSWAAPSMLCLTLGRGGS